MNESAPDGGADYCQACVGPPPHVRYESALYHEREQFNTLQKIEHDDVAYVTLWISQLDERETAGIRAPRYSRTPEPIAKWSPGALNS